MSTRAAVVHFDGDPFQLSYWFSLYDKYWRGEVDKLYVSLGRKKEFIDDKTMNYNVSILNSYPEVVSMVHDDALPETGNSRIIPLVKEGLVLLTESDNWIFRRGFVKQCFDDLDTGLDIISGPCSLFANKLVSKFKHQAFMRSMFFIRTQLLLDTDLNFLPIDAPKHTGQPGFETFGWISYQLSLISPKIKWINANVMSPGTEFDLENYKDFPYFHIRGMSSSTFGMGSTEYKKWLTGDIKEYDGIITRGSHTEWVFIKATAFKEIAYENFKDRIRIPELYEEYGRLLKNVKLYANLPEHEINKFKRFFKELLNNDGR